MNPHSIGIFVSDTGTIDFIPTFNTKAGFGQETDYFHKIEPPYTFDKIGAMFIQVWNEAKRQPIIDSTLKTNRIPAFKIISGGKGYLAFQRRRQMVCALFGKELLLQYWYKQKRGFGVNKGDKEITKKLPLNCSPFEIGKAIDEIYFEINQHHIV